MRVPHVLPAALLAGALQSGLLLTASPLVWTGAQLSLLAWLASVAATLLLVAALAWPRARSRGRRIVTATALGLLAGTWLLLSLWHRHGNLAAWDLTSITLVFTGAVLAAQRLILAERPASA